MFFFRGSIVEVLLPIYDPWDDCRFVTYQLVSRISSINKIKIVPFKVTFVSFQEIHHF